jgi:hypothetical protein
MPVMPQNAAGWRMEPPVSVPVAAGARRAATAAARAARGAARASRRAVPGVAHRAGTAEFSLAEPMANSSQLSLPRVTAPALGQLARTTVASNGRCGSLPASASRRWWGSLVGDEDVLVGHRARPSAGPPAGGSACVGGARLGQRGLVVHGAGRRPGPAWACARGPGACCASLNAGDLLGCSAASRRASSATRSLVQWQSARSLDHLGHEEQAVARRPGALRWLASRWSGSLTASSRRRRATVLHRRQPGGQRLHAAWCRPRASARRCRKSH